MEEKLELKVEDNRSYRPQRRHRSQRPVSSRGRYYYSRMAPPARWSAPCPPLEVVVEPREQSVGQGSPASLRCSVTAGGRPVQTFQYSWQKVRDQIDPLTTEVVGGELRLRSVSVSDRGLYVCHVTSSCGAQARASSILEVERRERPSVELYPANMQVVRSGDTVLFQCRYVTGIPTPLVTWRREDGQMPATAESLPGGVLKLSGVSRAEAGRYLCRASNSVGEADITAVLVVQDPPQIRLEPEGRIVLSEGERLTVTCHVTGGDPVPSVHWEKHPSSLPLPGQHSLVVESVRQEDQGTYLCRANNTAGTASQRLQLIVHSQHMTDPRTLPRQLPGQPPRQPLRQPPRRPLAPPQTPPQTVSAGSRVDLHCVTGQQLPPQADIVWSRSDGHRLASRHRVTGGVLSIVSARTEDSGHYLCEESFQAILRSAFICVV